MANLRRNRRDPRYRNTRPKRAAVLERFIREHGLRRGVELGVFKGETFFFLLARLPDLELTGVDTWEPGKPDDYATGARSYADFPLRAFHERICEDIRPYLDRAGIIRSTTVDAAERFEDASLDFVFIDADHTYEGVRADILAWKPKARWVTGHDIDFPGVRRAVEELLPGWFRIGETCWAAR